LLPQKSIVVVVAVIGSKDLCHSLLQRKRKNNTMPWLQPSIKDQLRNLSMMVFYEEKALQCCHGQAWQHHTLQA